MQSIQVMSKGQLLGSSEPVRGTGPLFQVLKQTVTLNFEKPAIQTAKHHISEALCSPE